MTRILHGESKGYRRSSEFSIWSQMVRRCHDPKAARFADYGGRGIVVCERWRASVTHFIADMGRRPSGHSLDRVDNDGPYSPENCRWATALEQGSNKRNNVVIEAGGVSRTLAEWARVLGVNYTVITARIRRFGYTPAEAVTVPFRRGGRPVSRKAVSSLCDARLHVENGTVTVR